MSIPQGSLAPLPPLPPLNKSESYATFTSVNRDSRIENVSQFSLAEWEPQGRSACKVVGAFEDIFWKDKFSFIFDILFIIQAKKFLKGNWLKQVELEQIQGFKEHFENKNTNKAQKSVLEGRARSLREQGFG